MMENENGSDIGELHSERIMISGDRYLIFYTFTNDSGENGEKPSDSTELQPDEPFEI
jgi:hypothetical protein